MFLSTETANITNQNVEEIPSSKKAALHNLKMFGSTRLWEEAPKKLFVLLAAATSTTIQTPPNTRTDRVKWGTNGVWSSSLTET